MVGGEAESSTKDLFAGKSFVRFAPAGFNEGTAALWGQGAAVFVVSPAFAAQVRNPARRPAPWDPAEEQATGRHSLMLFLAKRVFATGLTALAVCWSAADDALAQLRIVTYNTANGQFDGALAPRAGMDFVLRAIGEEIVNGVQRPIDVIALQEQYTTATATQAFVDLLNGIYGPGTYARGFLDGDTSDSLRRAGAPALVYNTQTVQLIGETKFGDVGTSNGTGDTPAQQPRSTMRYQLRPVGYDERADFYVYSSHMKSDTGVGNNNRRLVEAQAIRTDADALGAGVYAVYAGDFNIQSSSQAAYQHLRSAGNGQAVDPLNLANTLQSWNNNTNFAAMHTQSPTTFSRFSGQTLGGMDDRFDFQLVTSALFDNEGMSLLAGSYRAFGNNGTTYDSNIDDGSNTYAFNGVTFSGANTRAQLLTNLASVTDHLPVVADYQVPAIMGATLASSIPPIVPVGVPTSIDLLVRNLANVTVAHGADELDYSFTVSGDLSGLGSGTTLALAGGNLHSIMLDTATPGLKSGSIVVTTDSQAAANPLVTIPVSYLVGTISPADFNVDGYVDATDLATWQTAFGMTAAGDATGDSVTNGADFLVWQRDHTGPGGAIAAVPEPTSAALALLVAAGLLVRKRARG